MSDNAMYGSLPLTETAGWIWNGRFVHNACGEPAYVHPQTNHLWACLNCQVMSWSVSVFFKPIEQWVAQHPQSEKHETETTLANSGRKWKLEGKGRFGGHWYTIEGEYGDRASAESAATAKAESWRKLMGPEEEEACDHIWVVQPDGVRYQFCSY